MSTEKEKTFTELKIYTEAKTLHEMFGYESEKKLLEESVKDENLRLGALTGLAMLLMTKDIGITGTLIVFLRILTGVEIRTVGNLFDYWNKKRNDEEMVELSARVIQVNEDNDGFDMLQEILKEIDNMKTTEK